MENFDSKSALFNEVRKIITFWPIYALSIIFFLVVGYFYFTYADYRYYSSSVIQIVDKANDSEMSLPSEMTIFNRSMVNLENETSRLKSFFINASTCEKLQSNILFLNIGEIRTNVKHPSQWMQDFDFELLINPREITEASTFIFEFLDGKMKISKFVDDELVEEFSFNSYSTLNKNHDLPFSFSTNAYGDSFLLPTTTKAIRFLPFDNVVDSYIEGTDIQPYGQDSDQLVISRETSNPQIDREYINALINEYDIDGISDRQLEYRQTIEFVNTRATVLENDLRNIEIRKQNFKETSNISDIGKKAEVSIERENTYNSELFELENQKSIVKLMDDLLGNQEDLKLLPINIGISDNEINKLIVEYNQNFREIEKFQISAGSNNYYIQNLLSQLEDIKLLIRNSLKNYQSSLNLRINSLKTKEIEFNSFYNSIPENEKILRSINRELEIIESLYLLLIQKREEASINYAVVKPTIKLIDEAITKKNITSPKVAQSLFVLTFLAFLLPYMFVYLSSVLNNKIITSGDIKKLLPSIPVLGDVPFFKELSSLEKIDEIFTSQNYSRLPFIEALRIVVANYFITEKSLSKQNSKRVGGQVLNFTSSIKGEGKTLLAFSFANIFSIKKFKTIIIGCDLRNPQLHKLLNLNKDLKGLSNFIFEDDVDYKKYLHRPEGTNLDVMLSGVIPPDPTIYFESEKFSKLITDLKNDYDYIFLDSAPSMIISDTLVYSKLTDSTIYMTRSNHTDIELVEFINKCDKEGILPNIKIINNGTGVQKLYGYNYKYNYSYSYNYGYGYTYN